MVSQQPRWTCCQINQPDTSRWTSTSVTLAWRCSTQPRVGHRMPRRRRRNRVDRRPKRSLSPCVCPPCHATIPGSTASVDLQSPSHISKMVLSTVKKGPQRGTRTPSERQLNRQFPGSSTSQHNRSIELTLAEVIVQADSITTYSRVVTILSQEKLGRHFPADKKPGARHTIRA